MKVYDVVFCKNNKLYSSYGLFYKTKQAKKWAKHLHGLYKEDYGHLNKDVDFIVTERIIGEMDFYSFKPRSYSSEEWEVRFNEV